MLTQIKHLNKHEFELTCTNLQTMDFISSSSFFCVLDLSIYVR